MADGPLAQWREGRATLQVTALDGHVQTLPIALRDTARVQYEDGRVEVQRLEGSIGRTSLSAAGALPLSTPSNSDALLATLTGESITLAVKTAVRQRIEREERERGKATVEELLAIARRIAEAPNRDDRTDDEILGYDERGLPS